MIYFIEAVGGYAVKVGYCNGDAQLRMRLLAMQGGNHHPLRLLGLIRRGTVVQEFAIHEALDSHRLQGEWFQLSAVVDDLRRWIVGDRLPRASVRRPYAHRVGVRWHRLGMKRLVVEHPDHARAKILHALRVGSGVPANACALLACTERALYRWVDKLAIRDQLDKLTRKAEREGWLHKNRRPVKS